MLPQLVSPLIQLPLMNPQFLCQLLRADRLHSLHCSSLVFPTPPSISLPLLHSLLRGEFPCCLILGGQSSRGHTVGISRLRPQSPASRDPSASARNDKCARPASCQLTRNQLEPSRRANCQLLFANCFFQNRMPSPMLASG